MTRYNNNAKSPIGLLAIATRTKKFWLLLILVLLVMISAISIIYVQAQNRILFSQLQVLENSADNLSVEWGQLLLEQSTWSTQPRIQKIAQSKLDMSMPKQQNIIMVTEDGS